MTFNDNEDMEDTPTFNLPAEPKTQRQTGETKELIDKLIQQAVESKMQVTTKANEQRITKLEAKMEQVTIGQETVTTNVNTLASNTSRQFEMLLQAMTDQKQAMTDQQKAMNVVLDKLRQSDGPGDALSPLRKRVTREGMPE